MNAQPNLARIIMERTLRKHRLADIEGLPNRGDAEASAGLTRPARTAPAKGRAGRIDSRLVCLLKPASAAAERFNRLRHAIEAMRPPDRALTVGVTSPSEADGKTLTAINLAGALARDERARVLLADLDLRSSGRGIGDYLDLNGARPGITDWIGREDMRQHYPAARIDGFNLDYLHRGSGTDSIYELLRSPGLDELLEQARRSYQFIVVDTPHALLMSDVDLISRVVDGFLIVVRAGHTTRTSLENTLNLIAREKVLGLVFNGAPQPA
jgi:Mrp family chromosome partitioning ATPase